MVHAKLSSAYYSCGIQAWLAEQRPAKRVGLLPPKDKGKESGNFNTPSKRQRLRVNQVISFFSHLA